MSGARLAAIDLGSNSFHLLVADDLGGGRMRRRATRKIRLRLAEPVARDGALGPEGRGRAAAAFTELVADARDGGAGLIRVVGTEALRQAADGELLRRQLEEAHGVPIRVLDGEEEAALSLRGMLGALRLPGPVLGLDLGGGSYEVAFGTTNEMEAWSSLPLGPARLSNRGYHDPPRLVERQALHTEATAALRPMAAALGERGRGPLAVGTAGTIRDLGRLGLALAGDTKPPSRIRGLIVSRDQLERAVARVCAVGTVDRAELPGVSAKRADLLPLGGVVLLATMEVFDLEQLTLCDWGLREGVLLEALTCESHRSRGLRDAHPPGRAVHRPISC